ncbi:MAG: ABC-2 transporter permease [Lachnospiraceae bacterium]|nr:ABC-2 transporter permease [Lachnospiraceae bacterium]
MRGLLKNNFYAAYANVKVFSIVMILLGIFVVAMDNKIPSLIIGYLLLAMIGFSFNSIASLRKESSTKWSRYKLTAPIKRSAIVQSYFLSLLLWLIVGMVFAGIGVAMSIMLHGYPFDRNTDVFMLFVLGIGISLFMGAIFFPLFYLGGEERNEVFLVISLLCSIGLVMGLSTFVNTLFPAPMSTVQIILGGIIILACALIVFILAYPLTVSLYYKKEY